MRRLAIVGASGMLGRRLLPGLRAALAGEAEVLGTCFRNRQPGLEPLDVTDPAALEQALCRWEADDVLWLAGWKDVPACEREPARAALLNALSVESAGRIVRARGLQTRLVYLSTDYVFAGDAGPHADGERCAPSTVYGSTKRDGEEALLAGAPRGLVLRSSAVMARDGGFLGFLLGALRKEAQVPLFDDTVFSPTPMPTLLRAVAAALALPSPPPVLHAVGGIATRYALGVEVAGLLGLPASRVVPAKAPAGSTLQRDLSMTPSPALAAACAPWRDDLAAEVRG
jgi:dTDP-4-dehydrorhamnose reductase